MIMVAIYAVCGAIRIDLVDIEYIYDHVMVAS